MAAPVATVRQEPSGIPLEDGHPSRITFARFPAVIFWEKEISPPGVDGGSPKDMTTFFNRRFKTKRPRKLLELTDGSVTVLYDPGVFSTIIDMINVEDTITIEHADGSTRAFYGYMSKFEPGSMKEGDPPDAKVSFVSTAYDHVNRVEAGETVTSVVGT